MKLLLTGFLAKKYTELAIDLPNEELDSDKLISFLTYKLPGLDVDIKRMQLVGISFCFYFDNGQVVSLEELHLQPNKDQYKTIELIALYTANFKFLKRAFKAVTKIVSPVFSIIKKIFGREKKGADTVTQPDRGPNETGGNAFGKDSKGDYGDLEVYPMVFGEYLVEGKLAQESTISINDFNLSNEAERVKEQQDATVGSGSDIASSGVTYEEINNVNRDTQNSINLVQELENQEQLLQEIREQYNKDHDISICFLNAVARRKSSIKDDPIHLKWSADFIVNNRSTYYAASSDKFYNTAIFTKNGVSRGQYEWIRPFKSLIDDFNIRNPSISLLKAEGREMLKIYCKLAKLQCYYDFYDCSWISGQLIKNNWDWIRSNEVGWSREEILSNFNKAKAEFEKARQAYNRTN